MGTNNQAGGTRYVFAGTSEKRDETGIKTCPRCGEMLFADMDVCYGCLYDFTKDIAGNGPSETRRGLSQAGQGRTSDMRKAGYIAASLPRQIDPLETVELDEVDDEADDILDVAHDLLPSVPPTLPPRHSKRDLPSADDTLDLSAISAPTAIPKTSRSLVVAVSSADMRVFVPLPSRGLLVGRDETNDIVLRSRSVSRSHLRLLPQDDKVLVEDCGATNPALIRGAPLSGTESLSEGDSVTLCEYTLEIRDCGVDAMAK